MVEQLKHWADLLLHADNSLKMLVGEYKSWTYLILILIIFCETGLVVTPFLPGDSLLFAAGTVASGLGVLNIYCLLILLFLAAITGDNSNYFIGRYIGPKVFNMKLRFVRKEYLDRTHAFYEKHGGQTLIIARFVPIIRTFAPFVAGVGLMNYKRFFSFCVIGNLLWINIFLWAGYFLGTVPFIQQHFSQVTLLIIVVSLIPALYGVIRSRFATK
jgi:membrane-associated protein